MQRLPFLAIGLFCQSLTWASPVDEPNDTAELSKVVISGTTPTGPSISTEKLLKVPGAGNDPLKAIEEIGRAHV